MSIVLLAGDRLRGRLPEQEERGGSGKLALRSCREFPCTGTFRFQGRSAERWSGRQVVYLDRRSKWGRTRCSRVCGRPVSADRGRGQLDSRISATGSYRLTVLNLCHNREVTLNERTCAVERRTMGQPTPTLWTSEDVATRTLVRPIDDLETGTFGLPLCNLDILCKVELILDDESEVADFFRHVDVHRSSHPRRREATQSQGLSRRDAGVPLQSYRVPGKGRC